MGMFNEIVVPCPSCGENHIFQTKSGTCALATYHISQCPPDELEGIRGDSVECSCGKVVGIRDDFKRPLLDFSRFVYEE